MSRELQARLILFSLLGLVGLFTGVAWTGTRRVTTIEARLAEQGGWMPAELTARVGESLQLRLVSQDVTHGFAVGQMEMEPINLFPGEAEMVSLTFDKPGKYTFYCTRWCGANHWRMRGTIEVIGEDTAKSAADLEKPPYIELGIDIDAPHPAQVTPQAKPSTAGIADSFALLDDSFLTLLYYRSHSPAQAWQELRRDSRLQDLSDAQVWSLVAGIWMNNTSPQQLAAAEKLYASNCAACHGENGTGEGVFAGQPEEGADPNQYEMDRHDLKSPVDFTDPQSMLGASPALLHGKIVRGGMGTGMPYWGPIFTDDQVWALVSYLYTFQFEDTLEVKP